MGSFIHQAEAWQKAAAIEDERIRYVCEYFLELAITGKLPRGEFDLEFLVELLQRGLGDRQGVIDLLDGKLRREASEDLF